MRGSEDDIKGFAYINIFEGLYPQLDRSEAVEELLSTIIILSQENDAVQLLVTQSGVIDRCNAKLIADLRKQFGPPILPPVELKWYQKLWNWFREYAGNVTPK